MNKVFLIGRTTKDIELRYTSSNKALTYFTLAVNRLKSDGADFIRCIAWEKTAELLEKYVKKGNRISVIGHIQTSTFEKDGEKKYNTDVVVETIEFLESKPKEETANTSGDWQEVDDAEIPF